MSLFCRHGRFTADCGICSKETVLGSGSPSARRRPSSSRGSTTKRSRGQATPVFKGPHSGAGPYTDAEGTSYVVRLERVPGGVRLAEWEGSRLRRRAPELELADLPTLLAGTRGVLADGDAELFEDALTAEAADGPPPEVVVGVSRGRTGDFKEELRVESLEGDRLRIARWVLRPGSGWELQDAAPMLPAKRFAEAVGDALRRGLAPADGPAAPPQP